MKCYEKPAISHLLIFQRNGIVFQKYSINRDVVKVAHPWKSSGENRSIWWYYEPSDLIMKYLKDMRDAVHFGLISYIHPWP